MNAPKPDRPSRRRTTVVASLALAGTLLAVPYIAQAASPADEPPTTPTGPTGTSQASAIELLREQVSLAANELYDTAHKDPKTGYSNIVVSATSAKDAGYTLYWKGEVPSAITKLIETQRTQGLHVSIQDAKYTRAELEAKTDAIARPEATVGGDTITSVGPSNDGNSLDVTVEPAAFVIPGSQQELDGLEADRSALTSLAGGIPVNVSRMATGTPTVMVPKASDMTRYKADGYLPGGAGIGSPNYCTTGFTVTNPLTGVKYMTTAAHCVNRVGEIVKNGNKDKVLGKVLDIQTYNDSALIEIDPGVKTAPTVYGGYGLGSPTGGVTRVVRSSGRTFVGELLCTDGALLGEQCGGKVTALGRREWDKKNKVYRLLDLVSQVAGRILAGSGDSGGPVYAGREGAGKLGFSVFPRGVISMTFGGGKCFNPIPGFKTRTACSPEIGITNLEVSLKMHAQALNIPMLRVDTFS